MQYLSGVWDSLTGQASTKRKRSGDETEALPDRMTSLKLFSDQCPGRPQSSPNCSSLPEHGLLDAGSCATAETQLHAPGSYSTAGRCNAAAQSYCQQAEKPKFKPPPQPLSQQHAINSNHATYSARTASSQPSFTAYTQQHQLVPQGSTSTQPSYPQAQQHAAGAVRQSTSSWPSACSPCVKRLTQHCLAHPDQQQTAGPAASGLCCSEGLSPEACFKPSPVCADLPSPDLYLTESVADSPDDLDIMEEITSPSTPAPGVLKAFLALCQSPQVLTALSKLQASHLLPCPTTFSVLPLDVQQCPEAMSSELLAAGSMVQQWSKASQLEWTLAGMFALNLRAGLDPLDMDPTMLLSLLWILESCSSQYTSSLAVITSNYLAYTNVTAAMAGPSTPVQIRNWQQDMKASQLEILKRCDWRVHMDLEADLVPALQQLQQTDALLKLQNVLCQVEAESRHRRSMDAQLEAHRRQQAQHIQQTQHLQAAQAQQAQQALALACCQSSTKPPKPRDNMRNDQSSQHARLRHEAEGLHQSSLNGRYWQTGSSGSSHSACHQHETLIPLSHRARNRGVRTKLSW